MKFKIKFLYGFIRLASYAFGFILAGFFGYLISSVAHKGTSDYFLSKTESPSCKLSSNFLNTVYADTPHTTDPDGGDGGCP